MCFACLLSSGSALRLVSRKEAPPSHPSSDIYDSMCDESKPGFDAAACFEHVVGRTKASLFHKVTGNADRADFTYKGKSNAQDCKKRFYAYTLEEFEKEFPDLAKCHLTTYAAVVHSTIHDDPCKTLNKSAADFLVPPPYLAQECNWPAYGGGNCFSKANTFRPGELCKENAAKAFAEVQMQNSDKFSLIVDHNSEWKVYNLPAEQYAQSGQVRAKVNSMAPYYRPDADVSMPPAATARCRNTPSSAFEEPLEAKRYFVSFKGNLNVGFPGDPNNHGSTQSREVRHRVQRVLHNGRDRIIVDSSHLTYDFDTLLRSSRFLPIIGGDVEFSYRFNEAVCSGGVPVLITKAWVPPFHEFVPFETYGVRVHEDQVEDLAHILQSLPKADVEQRRKMARKMCNEAFQTTEMTVSALLRFHTSGASRNSTP